MGGCNVIATEHGRYGLSCTLQLCSTQALLSLYGMNRLMCMLRVCGVHSWQNGTRCTNGVKMLWCHSHLVWQVFEGSIPTCACFLSENFFVTCSCCFFVAALGVGEGRPRGRCMICQVQKYRTLLFTKNRVFVNSNLTP